MEAATQRRPLRRAAVAYAAMNPFDYRAAIDDADDADDAHVAGRDAEAVDRRVVDRIWRRDGTSCSARSAMSVDPISMAPLPWSCP